MRGKAILAVKSAAAGRITPAYAGKSPRKLFHRFQVWDHPRLCGEKVEMVCMLYNFQGSPPPMRGKDLVQNQSNHIIRITPAYAGKSCINRILQAGRWDHPRLCGEKQRKNTTALQKRGSPPPMRGKVDEVHEMKDNVRITPAYAGKSLVPNFLCLLFLDHPRLCGEKRTRSRKI